MWKWTITIELTASRKVVEQIAAMLAYLLRDVNPTIDYRED